MIPPEIYTFAAVFLGSVAGGIVVSEYALRRGKNMIKNSIQEVALDFSPMISNILKHLTDFKPDQIRDLDLSPHQGCPPEGETKETGAQKSDGDGTS